jgi:DNA polymerase-3 subunit delta
MITTGQAIRTIRAKKISPSYILFGGEPFLEDCIIDELYNFHINENISKVHYSMDQDSLDALLEELSSISLFQDKRIVVVREIKKIRSDKGRKEIIQYIDFPNPNVILVIILDEYDMKNTFLNKISKVSESIDTRTPFEKEMKKWILFYLKKQNIKITNDALNQYIDLYGDYISHVINEIKNSSLMLDDHEEINQDITSQLKGYDRLFPLWAIQDSLGKKDLRLSLEVLNSLVINGTKITVIVINLVNLCQQMLWKKMGKMKLEGYTGINKIISSRLKIYDNNFTFSELTELLQELRKIDILCKTISINHQLLLESFFVKTCEGLYV